MLAAKALHFDSAHYLDLPRYPQHPLQQPIATGMPSILYEPPAAQALAAQLAALQGQETATLGVSTLHLCWDWLEWARSLPLQVFLAADSYPLLQRLARRAFPPERLHTFTSLTQLAAQLAAYAATTPVMVIADTWQTRQQQVFPVAACLQLLQARTGWLLLDDTQGLGLLGANPQPQMPFGYGGGGILRWSAAHNERVIVLASLAKAFGIPLAVLSAPQRLMEAFYPHSMTRTYCSPPSPWLISHALAVLQQHAVHGDWRRQRLLRNIHYFQAGLRERSLAQNTVDFPVQRLALQTPEQCQQVYRFLLKRGIHTLLTHAPQAACALTVILRAQHRRAELDVLLDSLHDALHRAPLTRGRTGTKLL